MIKSIVENTMQLDVKLFLTIFRLNGQAALDSVMKLATISADGYYYVLMFTFLWVIIPSLGGPILFAGILGFAIELPVQHIIKRLTRRHRPFQHIPDIQFLLPPPDQFSFPSGHTAGAFLMAGLLSTAFPMMFIPSYLWAAAVGFSRIYLGVHFPSDVLAGAVLGIMSATAGFAFAGML